jgi:16S rRNA (guanine527-N7)-methyltransferase
MSINMENMLIEGAGELGISLDKNRAEKFFLYMDLLKEWNKRINLTSIEKDTDIIIKHFIDSLSILPCILSYYSANSTNTAKTCDVNNTKTYGTNTTETSSANSAKTYSKNSANTARTGNASNAKTYDSIKRISLMDIGSGAGFPGIPLKIACDSLDVTMIDAVEKKVKFLEECICKLKLNGIKALHGRAEDYGKNPSYREKFDISTARAVASLPILLEYGLPFVKIGGIFIAMKGKKPDEINDSMNALDILGGKIEQVKNIILPFSDNKRSIITIKKFRQIPANYPRKAGKPSKMPLM